MSVETIPTTCESCPRHRAGQALIGVVGWLIAAFAAVSVSIIPYDFEESICGVWGCFPPIQALVSIHLLWFVVLAAGFWGLRRACPRLVRPVGFIVAAFASVAISLMIADDLPHWLEYLPAGDRHVWPKRVGYLLATHTDVPMVQSWIAGISAVIVGRRVRGCRGPGIPS